MTTPVTLTYAGVTGDADPTIATLDYAQSQATAVEVTDVPAGGGWLTSTIGDCLNGTGVFPAANALVSGTTRATNAYVTTTMAPTAALITDVVKDQANYLRVAQFGAHSGVAQLNSSATVPTAQMPSSGIVTDRITTCYSVTDKAVGTIYLTALATATSDSVQDVHIASLSIPDPGWPWVALPFAWVLGNSEAQSGVTYQRMSGNAETGQITVTSGSGSSAVTYGIGVGASSIYPSLIPLVPFAGSKQAPSALNGALVLDLWGSTANGSSTGYQFSPTGLVYFVLVAPFFAGGA